MSRREIMQRVRAQASLVRRLNEQLKSLSPDGIRSIRLDGMPRGLGGLPGGLDTRLEKKEALERILKRETRLRDAYEKEARAQMETMKPEHYAFCALYYIAGLQLDETAEAMDRGERQCRRYRREIEAE